MPHRAPSRCRAPFRGGFSLVELIVVVAVVSIMSVLLFMNYGKWGSRVAINNAAYEMVSHVREAQASAMAVKRHPGGAYPSWGLYVSRANPTQAILYGDVDRSRSYTPGGTCGAANSECVQIMRLRDGVRVSSLCGTFVNTSKPAVPGTCAIGSTSDYFDIFFQRPFSDIEINGDPGDGGGIQGYRAATITLLSPRGYTKGVTVNYASEMSVQ